MTTRTFATCCSTCPSRCRDVHSPLCILVLQLSSGAQGWLPTLFFFSSVAWYLSAGSGTNLFLMLKNPVASPTKETCRPGTLQLQHWIRTHMFRLSGLLSLEDVENLTLLTWITKVPQETNAFHPALEVQAGEQSTVNSAAPGRKWRGRKEQGGVFGSFPYLSVLPLSLIWRPCLFFPGACR